MIQTASPWAPGRSPSARLLTRAAVRCIEGYQRHVSPRKGFSCAYRVHHQAESCSQYAKRVLIEDGMAGALGKVTARFGACREAHLALLAIGADAARFADPTWLAGLGDGVVQARTWCLPTPVGCCMFST